MKFEVYQDKRGEWRWRIRWTNGRIRGDSGEGYKRKNRCIESLLEIQRRAALAEIVEV